MLERPFHKQPSIREKGKDRKRALTATDEKEGETSEKPPRVPNSAKRGYNRLDALP